MVCETVSDASEGCLRFDSRLKWCAALFVMPETKRAPEILNME